MTETVSQSSSSLQEQLGFETLLADLSARFINLPADHVDGAIKEAQRLVCEYLGIDLCALWQWEDGNPGIMVMTHLYRPLGGPPVPERMVATEHFPWSLQEVMARRIITLNSTEGAPKEAARDLEGWRHYGIKTNLTVPLAAGSAPPFGAVSFNDMRAERVWPDRLVKRLELVAQIFANALARKRSDQALRESETRLNMALESAGAGAWSMDAQSERVWASAQERDLFGFTPDEELTYASFRSRIHPDDCGYVQAAVEQALLNKTPLTVEYRITRPDGSLRWIAARGRPSGGGQGDPDRLMGVAVDITERKQRENELRASKTRVESAIEVAGLGFYEMGEDRLVNFLDDRGRDLVGVPPEQERRGREFWLAHIHPDDRPRMLEVTRRVIEEGVDRITVDYRYMHPERGLTWLHHVSRVLERDEKGQARLIVGVMQDISERKRDEESLRRALDEVRELRDQLQSENIYLREQMRTDCGHGTIVGESEPIARMLAKAKQVAPTDSSVLITGETGTGKELLAQAIHDLSPRSPKPLVKVNCAALPAPLIEGELFGREKGAYTGAMTRQSGRFEVADGSTIFLDEIGDLPVDLQAKLLRVLENGQFERLGSNRTVTVDVRIIAATNHDLDAMVSQGEFRKDLFHRLNVFPIKVPPLRERVDDIPLLVWGFVHDFNAKMGRSIDSIPKQTMEMLKQYPWPGNVRELRNLIERAMILSEGRSLEVEVPSASADSASQAETLEEVERQHILDVLEQTLWRVSGKGGAAEVLGLRPTTLHSRMKKLGISRLKRRAGKA